MNSAGNYKGAYAIYATLTGYRDVDNIIANDGNIAAAVAAYLAQFEVGNTVTFGRYEQDDDTTNGAEDIEWLVLANDGETATLISKYGLDAKAYNEEGKSVTWENCTLRKWLNGEFLNAAFTAGEQGKLSSVAVTADKNPSYSTNPGNDTQDKVFLLSIDEVERYFDSDNARVCTPMKTAVANGAYASSSGACWWWLRSPGIGTDNAADVGRTGLVSHRGDYVDNDNGSVRPVVVLRLL